MARRHALGLDPRPDPTPVPAGDLPLIKVVGVSGSGKSTLVRGLRNAGYHARPISQEHSNVPTLWQQFEQATLLIYLNVSLEGQRTRRPDVTWSHAARQDEVRRLIHAWEHADLRIDTTHLASKAVLEVALTFLENKRTRHAPGPLEAIPATGSAHAGPSTPGSA
jgi:RNase adaptor protein for sRNA GlmZ degradation